MDPRNNLFGAGPRGGPPPPRQGPSPGGMPPPRGSDQMGMPARGSASQPPEYRGGGGAHPPRRAVTLRVEQWNDRATRDIYIYTNICAVSPNDFPPNREGSDHYVLLRGPELRGSYVVTARPTPGWPDGCIYMSDPQRSWCSISVMDTLHGEIYDPFASGTPVYIGSMDIEIAFASARKTPDAPYEQEALEAQFLKTYSNQMLAPGQRLLMMVKNVPISVLVKTVQLVDLSLLEKGAAAGAARQSSPGTRGILVPQTRLTFYKDAQSAIKLKGVGKRSVANAIISPDFDFNSLGIGGLDNEFATIFRRAFASRIFPPDLIEKLGSRHCKGILLYGPPGTGKTLIARKIGQLLNAREPIIVNGPELLNKYVGASEENVRKLFTEAEKEYKAKGEESGLHIIIFDEFDSIAKTRGSSSGGTGVGDNIVNQLLTKLDGVESLNNILIIGMTNRKDLIDEALLRPGRLDVQLEINLPDEPGREQIFKIHTTTMRNNGILESDVDLSELAANSKNYSGAEISGVVQAATTYAFGRHINVGTMASVGDDASNLKVTREDFLNALAEVRPAFGASETSLDTAMPFGILRFGDHVASIVEQGLKYADTIRKAQRLNVSAVLMHGPRGSGKTALAAHIAKLSQIPFVRVVSPATLAALSGEAAKKDYIHKVFNEAHRSPQSLIILDDLESLIEYNRVGQRFTISILMTIQALMSNPPPVGRGLLVLCTTSSRAALDQLGMVERFDNYIAVPAVSSARELGAVLHEMHMFEAGFISEAVRMVVDVAGGSLSVGVKDVVSAAELAAVNGGSVDDMVDELLRRIQLRGGGVS